MDLTPQPPKSIEHLTPASIPAMQAAAMAPSRAPTPAPGKSDFSFLYNDELLADVTIRIKLREPAQEQKQHGKETDGQQPAEPPAAKRPRTDDDGPGSGAGPQNGKGEDKDTEEGVVATIRAHAAVLAQRSAYFRASLMGAGAGMKEGRTRTITVELDDQQAVQDFKLMIRQSYETSYTEVFGSSLPKKQLQRLLALADAFEMKWCAVECGQALAPFKTYKEAVGFFDAVPDAYLDEEALWPAMKEAGSVIAKALGPVEALFTPREETYIYSRIWHRDFVLDERVAGLPVGAMEAVLGSQHLELASENSAFTLALAWARAREEDIDYEDGDAWTTELNELQAHFSRLLRCLRYSRMTCAFLACVAQVDLVVESGLLGHIMTQGIWHRELPSGKHELFLPRSRVHSIGYGSTRQFEFAATFSKEGVESLARPGQSAEAPLGLLLGFPCVLSLIRQKQQDEETKRYALAIQTDFFDRHPDLDDRPRSDVVWACGGEDNDFRGFSFKVVDGAAGGVPLVRGSAERGWRYGEEEKRNWCYAGVYHSIFQTDAFAFDAEGKLKVTLTIEVEKPQFE